MAPHPWRPATKRARPNRPDQPESSERQYPPSAYIQAYEARLTYPRSGEASSHTHQAERLIKWEGAEPGEEVWADRYNILHLLPSLPDAGPSSSRNRPPSPTASTSSSWDDLPLDEEALFALSGDEAQETYHREKKRAWVERLREERLRGRELADEEVEKAVEATAAAKAAIDEPPEAIMTLMDHTAKSLYASPNPKTLELRILANHATDDRFAFLRAAGQAKWTGEWEKTKRKVRVEMGLEKDNSGVALLGGYDSDSESDEEGEGEGSKGGSEAEVGLEPQGEPSPPPPPPPDEPDEAPAAPMDADGYTDAITIKDPDVSLVADPEEEKRRLRRQRLEEWKRNKAKG